MELEDRVAKLENEVEKLRQQILCRHLDKIKSDRQTKKVWEIFKKETGYYFKDRWK